MTKEIKVGDIVKVVDEGQNFSTYASWAGGNFFTGWENHNFASNGEVGVVEIIAPHETVETYGNICGVNFKGKKAIISPKGLELVERKGLKPKFKKGDKVKIISGFKDKAHGKLGYNKDMYYLVGKQGKIYDGSNYWFDIEGQICYPVLTDLDDFYDAPAGYTWPEYCLEAVKEVEVIKDFDITADISRQYTRDGFKVLKVFDSELEAEYPIVGYVQCEDGKIKDFSYTREGKFYTDGSNYSKDLVTRPELKPIQRCYIGMDSNDSGLYLNEIVGDDLNLLSGEGFMFEFIYDPNTRSIFVNQIKGEVNV